MTGNVKAGIAVRDAKYNRRMEEWTNKARAAKEEWEAELHNKKANMEFEAQKAAMERFATREDRMNSQFQTTSDFKQKQQQWRESHAADMKDLGERKLSLQREVANANINDDSRRAAQRELEEINHQMRWLTSQAEADRRFNAGEPGREANTKAAQARTTALEAKALKDKLAGQGFNTWESMDDSDKKEFAKSMGMRYPRDAVKLQEVFVRGFVFKNMGSIPEILESGPAR